MLSIKTDEAKRLTGVLDVITAADLPRPLPAIPIRQFSVPGMDRYLQSPLAFDKVRYVGEPVAVIVAVSRYVAEDAAELLQVAYEELPAVTNAEAALDSSSELLFPTTQTNIAGTLLIEKGDIDRAFSAANLVVEEIMKSQRHAAVPLETRGLVAEPTDGNRLTVWGAAKIPHVNRKILALMLARPVESIRMVELHVGGGFGARGEFYPEDYLIPFAALRLARSVAWVEDRAENLRASNHSREQLHHVAIALRSDGTVLALKDRVLNDTGAYVRTHGMTVPGMTASLLPGPYDWPAYRCEVLQVVTNKTPAGTYRAPGRFEANFVRERMIDIAAHRLGIDVVDVRRRNLIQPHQMPYDTHTHTDGHPVVYEVGDYPLILDKALTEFRYNDLRLWKAEKPEGIVRRGIGLALFVEKAGIGVEEYARVEIDSTGYVRVYSGVASIGQGVETVLAQICSEYLGIAFDHIEVFHGDTDLVPEGMGAFGSRATMLGGSAVMRAALNLRKTLLERASAILEASPEDLEILENRVVVRGVHSRSVPLGLLVNPETDSLSVEDRFSSKDMSFPYGVHVAAVEIDTETGGVSVKRYGVAYDIGRAINPTLVAGQIVGGAAQGIGGALLEELNYDESGQLLSGTLVDYLLPTVHEMPPVEVLITEDAPTPLNPLGAKGAGEAGIAAVGAAIANAVSDALRAEIRELPVRPERVLQLLRTSGDMNPNSRNH
jgi:CO/xanthine dehydrogenase Mo-binding subunit